MLIIVLVITDQGRTSSLQSLNNYKTLTKYPAMSQMSHSQQSVDNIGMWSDEIHHHLSDQLINTTILGKGQRTGRGSPHTPYILILSETLISSK